MPYISKTKREFLDPSINNIVNALRELECDDPLNSTAGNLNYLISSILSVICSSPRYDDINEMIGMLECCKLELYRRIAGPYEDTKCVQNGDVYNVK